MTPTRRKLAAGPNPVEIERKFLVNPKKLPDLSKFEAQALRQGYLHTPLSVTDKGILKVHVAPGKVYKLAIPKAHIEGLLVVLEQRAKNPSARIRLSKSSKGKQAWLTIKGKSAAQLAARNKLPAPAKGGFGKAEYEYSIPYEEAKALYELCDHKLAKVRYSITFKGHTWDVDQYKKELKDLWTAEVELKTEDEKVSIPPWCVQEVTGHPALTNHGLAKGDKIPAEVRKMQKRLVAMVLGL